MTPDGARASFALFQEAWELPPEERDAFLDARCADRPEIRKSVAELIRESERGVGLLTGGLLRLAMGGLPGERDDHGEIAPRDASELVGRGVPRHIGPYQVRRLIGVGGMGAVYEARQAKTDRRVAIKLVRAAALSSDAVRRIRREAKVLARLRHPGIAQIYEAGVCRIGGVKQPYIVMEYLEGKPLTQYVADRPLSLQQKLLLIAAVCDALHHAHQRGVIHRDLKPANILVEPPPRDPTDPDAAASPGQPRIIDFGVALLSLSDDAGTLTRHTGAGQVLGTLPYMSPEQIAAAANAEADDVDTRSDVYAVGVMLFELMTGRLPRACGGSLLETLDAARDGQPAPRARQFAPDLPADVEAIIAKALEPEPARRYQSASDLALDIRRFLANEPVQARPLTARYVVSRFIRRNRRRVAIAAAAFLTAVAGTAFAFVRVTLAEREAHRLLRELREFADFLTDGVVTELEQISGTNTVNRSVIERLLTQTERFLAQQPDDERLLHNYAVLLTTLATIDEHEGRSEDALFRARRAAEIRGRLAAARRDDLNRLMEHSVATVRLGDMQLRLGDVPAAKALYLRALEIDEQLVRLDPGSRRYLDNLGYSYERLAVLARQKEGDLAQAESLLRERMRIAQRVLECFPDHPLSVLGMCSAHSQLAGLLLDSGRIADAAPHAQEARRYADLVMKTSPDSFFRARYAHCGYVAHARYLELTGDNWGALEAYRLALAIAQRQGWETPRDGWPSIACFQAHRSIAALSAKVGDRTAATASWREAIRLAEAGLTDIPPGPTLDALLAPGRAWLAAEATHTGE